MGADIPNTAQLPEGASWFPSLGWKKGPWLRGLAKGAQNAVCQLAKEQAGATPAPVYPQLTGRLTSGGGAGPGPGLLRESQHPRAGEAEGSSPTPCGVWGFPLHPPSSEA